MFPVLLAQVPQIVEDAARSANDALQNPDGAAGKAAAYLVAQAWDQVWKQSISISSPIYQPLVLLGSGMAVICLVLFTIKWVKDLLHDESWRPSGELVWVIIVMILLRGPGDLNVAGMATGMRALINHTNAQISASMDAGMDLERKLKELGEISSMTQTVANLRQYCNDKTVAEELQQCLEGTRAQAESELEAYKEQYGPTSMYAKRLQTIIDNAWKNPLDAVVGNIRNTAAGLSTWPSRMLIQILLVFLQAAFQHMIEMAMLLTALLGPIAVGATLLPVGGKALYLWLTAFWSLGMCKLCLNVVTGVATYALHSSGQDPMLVGMVLGVLAPVLALGMASGGGMAIFNSLIQTGQSVVNVAARLI